MKVSIVIPNFNGAKLLKKNLSSVHEAVAMYEERSGQKAEIIVTDDASTDESKTVVSSFSFPIRFLEHEKNGGFSTNVNRGVKEATGEIIVLLNTDVSPEKDFLVPLLEHFSDDDVFAVGCMDKSIEDGKEILRGRGVGKWEKGFLVHRAGDLHGKNTLWASGGSSAFRLSLWKKLGGMDELFNPFYWEDIDLSYRAWSAGYRVLFDKKSVVRHEHEEGVIKNLYEDKEVLRIAYRNQLFFVWKNASSAMLIKHICWLPYHLTHAILRGDGNFLRGLFLAISLISEIRSKRKHIKSRERSDSDIIVTTLQ